MPSLRKLAFHSGNIVPKLGKDLTVFSSTTLSQPFEISSDSSMDCTSFLIPGVSYEFTMEKDSSDDSDNPPTRKRQRLDHLSQEEKVMRRKMKNRVAAQSARDRKKAKMTELEEQVLELEAQKKYLLAENTELRSKNQKLEEQNAELKLRLSLAVPSASQEKVSPKKEEVNSRCSSPVVADCRVGEEGRSLEYAEGTGSEPSYTLDDAIRLLACNSETDDLLDMLQQCSDSLLQCDINATQLEEVIENGKPEPSETQSVVGSSSESLESIKELIQFDHIYHKQEVSEPVDQCLTQNVISPSETSELIVKDSICIPNNVPTVITENDCLQIPIDTDEVCEIVNTSSTSSGLEQSITFKNSLPSPSSSDAGYDSSFSALSPCSDAYSSTTSETFVEGNPWDDTFSELFPSLV